MLKWIDSNNEVEAIPHNRQRFYNEGKNKLTAEQYDDLLKYANEIIDQVHVSGARFLVPGWKAPGSWEHSPLDIIWHKLFPGDYVSCAMWYGLLMMEAIIERDELWHATKTNFNRPFEQVTYWTD